ncbi:major facilitator superfamily domain-containing protein [Syncephalis fuscata]|nr:major facilitator superfamily domain-containing protein [Syncephalis fuscata]
MPNNSSASSSSDKQHESDDIQHHEPIDTQHHSIEPSKNANQIASTEPSSQLIFRFIEVNRGITKFNLITLLIGALFTICFAVFLNAAQSFVLSDILGIVEGKGSISGSLTLYDEIMSIFASALWGTLSDRIGRRPVWVAGYLVMAIGLFLYTVPHDVYPGLLLVRLVFAIGVAAGTSMLTATLADYSGGQYRGKIAAMTGIASGIGALIAVFVLVRLPPAFSHGDNSKIPHGIRATYYLCGAIALVVAVIMYFGLHRDATRNIRTQSASPAAKPPLYMLFWRGILAAKDPRVALAYITGFVARGDSIVVSLFITLWVNQYYIDNELCPRAPSQENEDIKVSCREAFKVASSLSGVAQVFALLGAPLFGFLSDRFSRGVSVMVAGLLGFIGCFGFGLGHSPTAGINYFWMCLIGLGEIGTIVTSLALAGGYYVPEDIRGSVAGVYSFIGGLGIMLASKLGGTLFDIWWQGGPFVVMGVLHIVVFLAAGIVWWYERRQLSARTINEDSSPIATNDFSSPSALLNKTNS